MGELPDPDARPVFRAQGFGHFIVYAIEQPADFDVGEVVIRPTSQA